MSLLESPHRGDSNEHIQYTIFYPRMTSFSDPKGIIHTVTIFHIKAEFL